MIQSQSGRLRQLRLVRLLALLSPVARMDARSRWDGWRNGDLTSEPNDERRERMPGAVVRKPARALNCRLLRSRLQERRMQSTLTLGEGCLCLRQKFRPPTC